MQTSLINYEMSSAIFDTHTTSPEEFPIKFKVPMSNLNAVSFSPHAAFYNAGGNSSIYKLFTCSSCTKPECYDSNSKELHISLSALHTFLSIMMNNHKTKALTKLLLIPCLVSLSRIWNHLAELL